MIKIKSNRTGKEYFCCWEPEDSSKDFGWIGIYVPRTSWFKNISTYVKLSKSCSDHYFDSIKQLNCDETAKAFHSAVLSYEWEEERRERERNKREAPPLCPEAFE